jgi:hypothetical protein
MLFALRQPVVLVGLVLGFVAGCMLRAALQHAVSGGLRSARRAFQPQQWLDPYGVVGALIGGAGWSPRPPVSRFRSRQVWLMVVAALVAHAVLAAVGFAGFVAAGGAREVFPFISSVGIVHGTQTVIGNVGQRIALGFGVENVLCGVLALFPLPPLELGVALWSTLPKSAGARRTAYRVLEEQWGIAVILVLLIVPLAGEQPALLQLIASFADRIIHAV